MVSVLLVNCDALRIPLADGSVHCCVTSPPYYSLRDYGISGQLGLEPSLDEYIDNMVQVFREVWRVLRDDGTCWLNLGDSYATQPAGNKTPSGFQQKSAAAKAGALAQFSKSKRIERGSGRWDGGNAPSGDLKPKDLMGVPWRVAFALQADGWYLRSDCIWHKPNPMPESVTDRPTKAHEYLFLLTKQARYFYDADAVREAFDSNVVHRMLSPGDGYGDGFGNSEQSKKLKRPVGTNNFCGRNRRTVWTIATAPFSGAHFATYPPALVEPCIKAGSSEHGVCGECGAPWEREVEKGELIGRTKGDGKGYVLPKADRDGMTFYPKATETYKPNFRREVTTTGWQPTCTHDAPPIPAIILDPFAGSGTTLMVARQLGRHGVGLDLSYPYLHDQARERLQLTALEEWTHGKKDGASVDDLPLFATQEQQT